ncbi:hypothetical protein AAKU55_002823 [Oxalobacteraceae bacterium GrIS 1.11]
MKHITHLAPLRAALLAALCGPGIGLAQELAGSSWTLVQVDNILPDGRHIELYGPKPEGRLLFDGGGHYSLQIFSANRAPFPLNDKSRGSADDYKAAVMGTNAHVGKYALDAAGHSLTFNIEHASFPNWDGTVQKRAYSIVGDILRYTVPAPTSGGGAGGEVAWRRLP